MEQEADASAPYLEAAPMQGIPQPYGFVEAAGDQHVAVGGEGAAEDVVRVALERFQQLARVSIPEDQGEVVGGSRYVPAGGVPAQV